MKLTNWPKRITEWHNGDTGYMSIPFTWLLPVAKRRVQQRSLWTSRWILGGPAVQLMPGYFDRCDVTIVAEISGVLQRVNPQATRTTIGCVRACKFCGVSRIEGAFCELEDWPNLPVLCDNNLLAASDGHIERVCRRLREHGWCDFNQGLDARLLTAHHANLIASIGKPMCRLSLDHGRDEEPWTAAVERLRSAGIPKQQIGTYVLCGFDGTPGEAWERCRLVELHGLKPYPMWYHRLDALQANTVTPEQTSLGWTNTRRRELMCWFYFHRTLEVRG